MRAAWATGLRRGCSFAPICCHPPQARQRRKNRPPAAPPRLQRKRPLPNRPKPWPSATLDAELAHYRAEIAAAKAANAAQPAQAHDYNEAATRDLFIDLLLKEAGWALDQPRDREFEVQGMPNNEGKGFVDYVLWSGERPLAIVEAKRTRRSAQEGQQQARLYADCLQKSTGHRPVIYGTNGYEHWIWDALPRPLSATSTARRWW